MTNVFDAAKEARTLRDIGHEMLNEGSEDLSAEQRMLLEINSIRSSPNNLLMVHEALQKEGCKTFSTEPCVSFILDSGTLAVYVQKSWGFQVFDYAVIDLDTRLATKKENNRFRSPYQVYVPK